MSMISKYAYGDPFHTEAAAEEMEVREGMPEFGEMEIKEGFTFSYRMAAEDIVYGLGEANRGLNKRNYCYISNCTDEPNHTEEKRSLYAAHNFIIISGRENFGLFFDYPSKLEIGRAHV